MLAKKNGYPAGPSISSLTSGIVLFFSALAVTTSSLFVMNDIYDG